MSKVQSTKNILTQGSRKSEGVKSTATSKHKSKSPLRLSAEPKKKTKAQGGGALKGMAGVNMEISKKANSK